MADPYITAWIHTPGRHPGWVFLPCHTCECLCFVCICSSKLVDPANRAIDREYGNWYPGSLRCDTNIPVRGTRWSRRSLPIRPMLLVADPHITLGGRVFLSVLQHPSASAQTPLNHGLDGPWPPEWPKSGSEVGPRAIELVTRCRTRPRSKCRRGLESPFCPCCSYREPLLASAAACPDLYPGK